LLLCTDFYKIRQASNASRTIGGSAFRFKFNGKFYFYRTNLTLPYRLKPRKILDSRVKSRTRIKQIIILKALLPKLHHVRRFTAMDMFGLAYRQNYTVVRRDG